MKMRPVGPDSVAHLPLPAPVGRQTPLSAIRRLLLAGGILAGCGLAGVPDPGLAQDSTLTRLLAAYPEHLAAIEANDLVWTDGTRMPIDDAIPSKSHAMRLETADIKDMLAEPYPDDPTAGPPGFEADPGRARNTAFFDKMYGSCAKGETQRHLVDVVWLPRKWGRALQVTRINGVADRLAAVSRALDALPPRFDPFLFPAAGGFACRPIAGTRQPSAHGHGIAVDIALRHAHYWRWTRPGADKRYQYRNSIPREIVAIFAQHGFIWGGAWYHFDTMHFEYRPELLPPPR